MSKQQRRPAKSLRATRQKRQLRNRLPARNAGMTMYKSPRTVMPDEFDTKLKYLTFEVLTNVGGTTASLRFQSEAYDVDPALASTAMAGFTEFANFYQRYRTLALRYKFSVANQENFSVSILHGFNALSIASGSLGITYAGNPLFTTSILGPLTGMGTRTYTKKASVTKIVGTAQPLFDDLYTGSTTSATLATAGTVYCYLGALSPVAFTAAGLVVTVEIELSLRFYRPRPLLT